MDIKIWRTLAVLSSTTYHKFYQKHPFSGEDKSQTPFFCFQFLYLHPKRKRILLWNSKYR